MLGRGQEFLPDGGFVRRLGTTEGRGPGQLSHPRGLAVSAGGELAVCDSGNHRSTVVDFDSYRVMS